MSRSDIVRPESEKYRTDPKAAAALRGEVAQQDFVFFGLRIVAGTLFGDHAVSSTLYTFHERSSP